MKIRIQNAVPARLVHRRREHCVVQHRVQELTELTTISESRWQNRQNILAANKIRNSIPLLGALKLSTPSNVLSNFSYGFLQILIFQKPDSGLDRFKQARHWLGAVKEITLCSRGFSRGSQ